MRPAMFLDVRTPRSRCAAIKWRLFRLARPSPAPARVWRKYRGLSVCLLERQASWDSLLLVIRAFWAHC